MGGLGSVGPLTSRIAVAGFQHETNTFGVSKAQYRDFEIADSWPPLLTGNAVLSGTRGINLPIAGFVAAAQSKSELEVLPILWCAAEPSSHVTNDAFEQIAGDILAGIDRAGAIDGVYLDLHGAMVTESYQDGEGELLRRLRQQVGPDLPIVVSLDLHANLTADMVAHASSMAIYRTYPHLDMADTGERCVDQMLAHLQGYRPAKAYRQVPFLIPLHAQYTGAEPCNELYEAAEHASDGADTMADIALGFSASDIHDAGPSIVAYAPSQEQADSVANDLLAAMMKAESVFDCAMQSPQQAVHLAMANTATKPVILADVQDNPGAGSPSDTTGLLKSMVEEGAQGAVLGLLCDPDIAALAHKEGVGATIEGALGGKANLPDQPPFVGRFVVEALSDGQCRYTGEMYGGGTAVLGKCVVLRVVAPRADVRVVVSSHRSQCLDRAIFEHIGIDLETCCIIGVKSTVHFRADFEPLAAKIISVAAPGCFCCELDQVAYKNLRSGVRLGPMGPAFSG